MIINDIKISFSDNKNQSIRMLEDDSVFFKSDPNKKHSIFRISYERWPKGYYISRDNRENAIIVFIVKGTLEYNDGSGKKKIGKGEIVCSSPGYPLYIEAISQEVQLHRITLTGKKINQFLINSIGFDNGRVKIQNSLELISIYQIMLIEAKNKNFEYEKHIYNYFNILSVLIKRNLYLPKNSIFGKDKLFEKAKFAFDKIELNKISVAVVAEQLNVSPEHLSRVFKSQIKMAPVEYILNRKMNQASKLLTTTTFSLFQIAEAIGYANEYVFSRAFKKFYGLPPGKWRKNHDTF
ncbi:MAG: hypothetical protein COA79_25055 [Planctomycetota bacterium]|nr:MAG: hypothetical protein COA79_25055 [Planctomycetota bacterium]